MSDSYPKLLKKDIFGANRIVETATGLIVRRDASEAAIAVRWLARHLLAREARALLALAGTMGVPRLVSVSANMLEREYIAGVPMQHGQPRHISYFHNAASILRTLHRLGVVHNDLAKEPNLLVTEDGKPAIIDFQLAWCVRSRGRLFRVLAREDIRHLLKHKRTYCADKLTGREKQILAKPAMISRIFMATIKPVYLFITRKILRWKDREGAGDRL